MSSKTIKYLFTFYILIHLCINNSLFSQSLTIHGRVYELPTDSSLPFTNVIVTDSFKSYGSAADLDGTFKLEIKDLKSNSINIEISSFDHINIELINFPVTSSNKIELEKVYLYLPKRKFSKKYTCGGYIPKFKKKNIPKTNTIVINNKTYILKLDFKNKKYYLDISKTNLK